MPLPSVLRSRKSNALSWKKPSTILAAAHHAGLATAEFFKRREPVFVVCSEVAAWRFSLCPALNTACPLPMSSDDSQIEMQKLRVRIRSLSSKYQQLQVESNVISGAEETSGQRLLANDAIRLAMQSIRNEIDSLEARIDRLIAP